MSRGPTPERYDESIYVLLTDTGTLFTRMIKNVTAAPYNHASLAMDEDLNELFSFGRKRPDNPWSAGFVREDVYEGTYRRYPQTRCALLRLRVTERQRAAAVRIVRSFQQNEDAYRYNLIGLLGVMMNRDLGRKNAFFCSQFVSETLLRAGLELFGRPSGLVTPDDFLKHRSFDIVYEGELYGYPRLNAGLASIGSDAPCPAVAVRTRAVV